MRDVESHPINGLMKPHIDRVEFAHGFLSRIFAGNLHAKRIESLANGALGVMTSDSLVVSIIGHPLAQSRGLIDKHAIKQVDRLSSNRGVVVWEIFAPWAREVVGPRKEIVVAMDWTDFDVDDQTTAGLEPRHSLWPNDTTAMAEGPEGRTEGPARRLRGSLSVPVGRGATAGLGDDDPGRSRLRRHEVVRLSRRVGLRSCHPVSRQHPCHRGRRRNARRRQLGRRGRTSARAARRRGHGGPAQGRRGRLRPCQEHERALVSGRQRR
jgi:hypothetical protein